MADGMIGGVGGGQDLAARARRIPGEAVELVAAAAEQGLALRVAGSVALHLHCDGCVARLGALGRRALQDIDFWARDADHRRLPAFFEDRGYVADPSTRGMREWGIKRLIFEHPVTGIKVDVFLDALVMAHTIDFRDRLGGAGPAVDEADLLLSKLQIHEITANDLIDLAVMLADHELAEGPGPGIDLARVLSVLGADWGFWYEALANLDKLAVAVDEHLELATDVRTTVHARSASLRTAIETCPKDRRWKLRARVGARKRWYEIVEEVDRA